MSRDSRKFREMILYVARSAEHDPRCGATKLNKILFYADFWAYRKLGQSISGRVYRKRDFGPVPHRMAQTVANMEAKGDCAWARRDYHGRDLKKLVPLREPDLSLFDSREIDLIGRVIDELWELNATEVSDLSHRFVGWQAASMGEEIPYETVFVGDPAPLAKEEEAWALDAVREFSGEALQGR